MLIEYVRKSSYKIKDKSMNKKCKFVASRIKKGVLVALLCKDNIVRIGWSLCNKKDKFTKRGLEIAIERAEKHTTVVPHSIHSQLENFILRVKTYYKDKEVEINIIQPNKLIVQPNKL